MARERADRLRAVPDQALRRPDRSSVRAPPGRARWTMRGPRVSAPFTATTRMPGRGAASLWRVTNAAAQAAGTRRTAWPCRCATRSRWCDGAQASIATARVGCSGGGTRRGPRQRPSPAGRNRPLRPDRTDQRTARRRVDRQHADRGRHPCALRPGPPDPSWHPGDPRVRASTASVRFTVRGRVSGALPGFWGSSLTHGVGAVSPCARGSGPVRAGRRSGRPASRADPRASGPGVPFAAPRPWRSGR